MNIKQIKEAAKRLRGRTFSTPLMSSTVLNELAGRRILVKPECLQHTGSFKYRGAFSAISKLPKSTLANGIVAYSSGNHAQAIALAAQQHNCSSVIVMPDDAPKVKINRTRRLGSEIKLYDRAKQSRENIAFQLADERGLTIIKPYDDPMVIAGQGTVGLEIALEAESHGIKNADVLICCGGGGLTSGIALALEANAPGLRARTCEPEGFDDTARSLAKGKICHNEKLLEGVCDAIMAPSPGGLTFPIMQRLCGPGLVVSENQALHAMVAAFHHLKLVLEPSGAVALAAALFHKQTCISDPAIVVLSGGNVDPSMFAKALAIDRNF